MGGRGATLITQSKREDEGILIQDERLKKMLQADDPESEYHNGMFRVLKRLGWSTRKSTDKNQDVNLMDQQDVVRDITKEYSKFFKNTVDVNEIRLRSLPLQKVGVLGVCWTPPDKIHRKLQMHVAIDKKYIDSTFAEKYQKISGRDNFNVPIHYLNSDKYVTTHEMGHALENSILYKKHNNYYTAFNMNKKLDANVIKDDVVKLAERELTHRKLTDQEIHLSEYARKNSREWFAETFTNLKLANEPEPIAKALELYLERLK